MQHHAILSKFRFCFLFDFFCSSHWHAALIGRVASLHCCFSFRHTNTHTFTATLNFIACDQFFSILHSKSRYPQILKTKACTLLLQQQQQQQHSVHTVFSAYQRSLLCSFHTTNSIPL